MEIEVKKEKTDQDRFSLFRTCFDAYTAAVLRLTSHNFFLNANRYVSTQLFRHFFDLIFQDLQR